MSVSNIMLPGTNVISPAYLPRIINHFFGELMFSIAPSQRNMSTHPTYNELIEEIAALKQRVVALESQNANTNTNANANANAGSVATAQTFQTAKSRRTRRRR